MPATINDTSGMSASGDATNSWSRSRRDVVSAVLIVVAMIGAGIAVAAGRSPAKQAAAGGLAASGGVGQLAVSIKDFVFDPARITAKAGSTVVWTNFDGEPHTVRTLATTTVKSGTLTTNDAFSFTFTTPGTYAYNCSIHPEMHGTVVVTA